MSNVLGTDSGWPILLALTVIPAIFQVHANTGLYKSAATSSSRINQNNEEFFRRLFHFKVNFTLSYFIFEDTYPQSDGDKDIF